LTLGPQIGNGATRFREGGVTRSQLRFSNPPGPLQDCIRVPQLSVARQESTLRRKRVCNPRVSAPDGGFAQTQRLVEQRCCRLRIACSQADFSQTLERSGQQRPAGRGGSFEHGFGPTARVVCFGRMATSEEHLTAKVLNPRQRGMVGFSRFLANSEAPVKDLLGAIQITEAKERLAQPDQDVCDEWIVRSPNARSRMASA
jgi:hypothetical protein